MDNTTKKLTEEEKLKKEKIKKQKQNEALKREKELMGDKTNNDKVGFY